jgi:hypothetical protein
MSPPLRPFPTSSTPQFLPWKFDIGACPTKELVQFQCILDENDIPICYPFIRSFKAYASPTGEGGLIQGVLFGGRRC